MSEDSIDMMCARLLAQAQALLEARPYLAKLPESLEPITKRVVEATGLPIELKDHSVLSCGIGLVEATFMCRGRVICRTDPNLLTDYLRIEDLGEDSSEALDVLVESTVCRVKETMTAMG